MKKLFMAVAAVALVAGSWGSYTADAQKKSKKEDAKPEGYQFTIVKEVEVTPIKDQSRSGTCWSFSGNAMLESELLRMGKGEYDLSEMWIVRNTYIEKAIKYVRMHGTINFTGGGSFEDVRVMTQKYGIVPEEAYTGMSYGKTNHDHSELDKILESYVKAVVKGKTLTTAWLDGYTAILDAYLGEAPEKFTYKGTEYTPESFARMLGLDMDDYVSITSYTHHPFYTAFAIEIPDNWIWGLSYNLPLDEMMQVVDNAIETGHSIAWASDVSEKGFLHRKGFAVIPEADVESMDGTEQARWVKMTATERDAALYKLDKPGKEKAITQQMRQTAFDNYETTDDHGMQITGTAKDQNGTVYYSSASLGIGMAVISTPLAPSWSIRP